MLNRILALAAAATLVAGCGALPQQQQAQPRQSAEPPATSAPPSTDPATPSPAQDTREALAETRSTLTPDLKIEVVGLNRVKGKHLVVQIRLTNTGADKDLPWTGEMGDETRKLGEIRWASGIGVLDEQARTWILPYKPAGGPCLCSDEKRDDLGYFIKPGASISLYAVMPAPSGNQQTATVVTPPAPPMLDVPVSDDPPRGEFPDPGAEPVTPLVHRVVLPSESIDRTEETADDGKDLQVNLSSDVLFAVDKAVLTPRAKAVLSRTAELIDASPATGVKVEGHADSSGNDAINDPLSARRAQAVKAALAPLLTRDGVAFQTKGYGSRRPLYGNDTEEGKRRNRRVTVTFTKPQAAAQPSPAEDVVSTVGPDGDLTGSAKAGGQPFAMEVTGLRRLPGGLGLLTYTIANEGTAEAWYNDLHNGQDWQSYKYQSASAVVLTDQGARRRYLPGRIEVQTGDDPGSYCACSGVSGVRLGAEKFAPGQKREFWGLFALPEQARALQVEIAGFRELEVPVR
ncbi:OmpA family protein [Nonomuraea typhae]|uniref:OmpA family protein n=1 Tax=Nonomuraea typhae TaxID=2603600 RepID=UPI0012FC1B02|nr:OmpA family protein [Nonomuraea typhae]